MLGSSRESLATLRASLDAHRGDEGFASVSGDLLAVASLLGAEKTLRQTLADSGQPAELRTGVVTSLFAGKVAAPSLALLTDIVSSRWSSDADLVDAVERLGAQAAFTVAETDGTLDRVEDELFAFGRAVDESPELQLALTDPSIPAARKGDVVRDIMGATSSPVSTALLAHAAGNLRGRRPAAAVAELARLASDQRRQVLAEVRAAIPLDAGQRTRLAAALTRLQGRQVRVNVIVDPEVVGGIVVRVGDDVIDGSVSSRLEQARRAVSA
jgi:F-type H+-transporting ATPase subunit delta